MRRVRSCRATLLSANEFADVFATRAIAALIDLLVDEVVEIIRGVVARNETFCNPKR